MSGNRDVLVHAGPDDVVEALSRRLLTRLAEIQARGRTPQVALTGGRIATQAYARLAEVGPGSAVDWGAVELWWGDERFVAADSPDRNAEPVLAALHPLGLREALVHRMPANDDHGDLDAAAAAYAETLGGTTFDVCLLGMGPDGHVASLFPDHPSSTAPGRVIAVRHSPKPPPDRISLTLEVINASAEVWLCVSGSDKAEATAAALAGSDQIPAARVSGRNQTVWLVDRAAVSTVPDLS